jgi:hypothetical protein
MSLKTAALLQTVRPTYHNAQRAAQAKLLVSLDEQHDEISKRSVVRKPRHAWRPGSTNCRNWLLLRPCRGGSKLRYVGLVERNDVSSPF